MAAKETGHRKALPRTCRAVICASCFFLILQYPLIAAASSPSTSANKTQSSRPLPDNWDPNRYISIDEITPGMEAYCLTDYGDAGVEKFGLLVLKVLRDIDPGRDAILVRGLDERFIRTGPVGGCSGSPVYIKDRLAGALAFAWIFSKDPVYGVTPIAEMLRVGGAGASRQSTGPSKAGLVFDFSKPIDFAQIHKQLTITAIATLDKTAADSALPCPMIVSGLPAEAFEQLRTWFEPAGFMAVRGIGGTTTNPPKAAQLVPGAPLAVPLLAGDIRIMVLGTTTEVRDGQVYGFGHNFLGYGPVDLPMATAEVYTVVSSLYRSTKLGNAREIVGAITNDQASAVYGRIGVQPSMIPLKITVNRYNDTQQRIYNCQATSNESLTPLILQAAVTGAAFQLGGLPPDHTVQYAVTLTTKTGESIRFSNISTSLGLNELLAESTGSIALLMNNPYKEVEVQSIEVDLHITPENISSHIWSVEISDTQVKRGQEVTIDVVIESFLSQKTKHQFVFKVPDDLQVGTYSLMVCGPYEYEKFLRKVMPYRFVALNYSGLIQALNDVLNIERGKLHCLLILPPGGISLESSELPDLPPTRTLILQSPQRALKAQPYPHWIEKTVETGTVIADKETLNIIVEN